ncbi:MAG: hypothetical protein HQK58_12990 [Deltaproteobacteria bacterium]|nr:hypothetical protein [Deltaproteobacteria bacterium]
MPILKRTKTKYPGVVYVDGTGADGKPERIYYIRYRKAGKQIEEKAGRQFQDDMTPAKAALLRGKRIQGDQPTNQERRQAEFAAKTAWTFDRLWELYVEHNPDSKSRPTERSRYFLHIKPGFGDKKPEDITPIDVDRLRLKMSNGSSRRHFVTSPIYQAKVSFGDRFVLMYI